MKPGTIFRVNEGILSATEPALEGVCAMPLLSGDVLAVINERPGTRTSRVVVIASIDKDRIGDWGWCDDAYLESGTPMNLVVEPWVPEMRLGKFYRVLSGAKRSRTSLVHPSLDGQVVQLRRLPAFDDGSPSAVKVAIRNDDGSIRPVLFLILPEYLEGPIDIEEEGARLGLATTAELLDEIRARIEVDHVSGVPGGLDYRTVDSTGTGR